MNRIPDALRRRLAIAGWAFTRLVPIATILIIAYEWNGIEGQARDSLAYHRAAIAAQEGTPLYALKPPPGPHEFAGEWLYIYPPPLAAFLSLLPRLAYDVFDKLWLLGNLAAFWLYAAALGRIARGSWSLNAALLWGTALFLIPGAYLSIRFANIDLHILALAATGLAVPALAGATLALAAAIKVTPIWPLLALGTRAPRTIAMGAAVAGVACLAACAWAFGLGGTVTLSREWLSDIMPTLGQGQFWGESFAGFSAGSLSFGAVVKNLSVSFAPVQLSLLAGWWQYEGGTLPAAIRLYLTTVTVGAPLLAAWLTRRRSASMQAAVVLCVALFAAPIVRPYSLPAVLLVMAAARAERRERSQQEALRPVAGPHVPAAHAPLARIGRS